MVTQGRVVFILATMLLTACSTSPKQLQAPTLPHSDLFVQAQITVPDERDIFRLTTEQKQEFLSYFHAAEHQSISPRERLYNFLSLRTAGFDYQGENHTASQAYALNSGNCISLAVLTKALADVAGVGIKFQNIISAPVFNLQGDYLVSSDHVRTFLFDSEFVRKKGNEYFLQPMLVIDYLPSSGDITGPHISESRFIAMFYRNLATDAVLNKQYDYALALLKKALALDPTYGAAINLTAVIHRRLNETDLASQFYQYGLQVSERKAVLAGNYAVLKQLNGDSEGANQLLGQLLSLQHENDPYLWYLLAKTAEQQQRFDDAVIYFNKAVERAPYVHQLYLELALALYRNQQPERARTTLAKAAELVSEKPTQLRYYAKLEALKLSTVAN